MQIRGVFGFRGSNDSDGYNKVREQVGVVCYESE